MLKYIKTMLILLKQLNKLIIQLQYLQINLDLIFSHGELFMIKLKLFVNAILPQSPIELLESDQYSLSLRLDVSSVELFIHLHIPYLKK